MKTAQSAGGIVINNEGNVAIVLQGRKFWSLPKGHIEKGESPLAAAKREIYEETGIELLKLIKPLGSYKRRGISYKKMVMKTIHMFLFTTGHEGALKPIDSANPRAEWVPVEEVANYLSSAKDREFFSKSITAIKTQII